MFHEILRECAKDLYLGYKVAVAATAIPGLAYFCTQLLVKVAGEESLNQYKGVGSSDNKSVAVLRTHYDLRVDSYKKERHSISSNYDQLREAEDTTSFPEGGLLRSLIASFLSGEQ